MKTTILTVLAVTTLALAGCAVDPTAESTNEEQGALTNSEFDQAIRHESSLGGMGGIAVANDPQKRLYDFDKTPRIGQRAPYEVSLQQLEAVGAAVPFAAGDDDIARRGSANCGVTCK